MDNQEQRDYAEEEYNRRTCPECDMQHERDELCIVVIWDSLDETGSWRTMDEEFKRWEWDGENMSVFPDYTPKEVEEGKAEELRQIGEMPLPVGYGDEWDGSSRNQSNDFFVGHSGHVTILWHVTNNPFEKYDSSKLYHLSARDGSALYVWCDLKFTDHQALLSIEHSTQQLSEIGSTHTTTKFVS